MFFISVLENPGQAIDIFTTDTYNKCADCYLFNFAKKNPAKQ